MEVDKLKVVLEADENGIKQGVNEAKKDINSMDDSAEKASNNISKSFSSLGKKLASVFAVGAVTKFTKECMNLASSANEVQNVVDVVFGNMNKQIENFANNASKSFGMASTEAKRYVGTMGSMLISSGIAKDEALQMSESITKLAGDMASFYDINQDEAFAKIRSGLSGEIEPLRQLGINMSEANLQNYMMRQGIQGTFSDLDQANQTMIRYNYLLQQTSYAQGDFARTSGSFANQVRQLKLNFSELGSTLGQGLISAVLPVITVFNNLLAKINQVAKAVANFFGLTVKIGNTGSGGGGGASMASPNIPNVMDTGTGGGSSGGSKKQVDGLNDSLKNVKKNAKEAKDSLKSLLGFDELNILQSNKNNDNSSNPKGGSGSGRGSGGGGATSGGATILPVDTEEEVYKADGLVKGINNALKELLKPLKEAWNNYGDWFLQKWDYFKNAFKYSCDQLGKFLKSVWTNGGEEFVRHLAEIGIAVGGVALQIGGDILISLGNLWHHLDPNSNPYTQAFINAMNKLSIAVRDFIISAGNWFGQFMNLGGQAFLNCIGDIIMIVGTTLAEVLADIITWVKEFMNSWAGHILIKACATTLNIVAGVIKAVAIVIEKCHKVLAMFLMLWATWKFTQVIKGLTSTETAIGRLAYTLLGKFANMQDSVKSFIGWLKNLINVAKNIGSAFLHPIDTLNKFKSVLNSGKTVVVDFAKKVGTNLKNAFTNLKGGIVTAVNSIKTFVIETGTNAIRAVVNAVASLGSYIAGLVGLTGAEATATVGATALNVALGALGIGALVALIGGLIVAVKKIGDKFGWWKNISNALGSVFGWLGDKLGWVWDKIKGFFGWDAGTPKCDEGIKQIGTDSEDSAQKMEQAFGKSSSEANKYLQSIHFDGTQLANEVTQAQETSDEKFKMLSKNANDYLSAITTGNKEQLNQMGADQEQYKNEVVSMYRDLNEAEKNEFVAKYGVMKGVNDDFLNYEGLSYQQRVARNSAYIKQIQQDETLSYDQKKQKINELKQYTEQSYEEEKQKYRELIEDKKKQLNDLVKSHGNTTAEGKQLEQGLKNDIAGYQRELSKISDTENKSQVKSKKDADKAIQQSAKETKNTAESEYKNLSKECKNALKDINKAIDENKKKIGELAKSGNSSTSSLINSLKKFETSVKNVLNSINNSINKSINDLHNKVNSSLNSIKNMINSFGNAIKNAFRGVFNNVGKEMDSLNRQYKSLLNSMIRETSGAGSPLKSSFSSAFSNIRRNSVDKIRDMCSQIKSQIRSLANYINYSNATWRIKMPHIYQTSFGDPNTGQTPKWSVSYFAKGGIVDRPTNAIIGEAGKEAIMPLENNTGWIDNLGDRIAQNIANVNSLGINNNSNPNNLTVELQVDKETLAKKTIEGINQITNRTGISPL